MLMKKISILFIVIGIIMVGCSSKNVDKYSIIKKPPDLTISSNSNKINAVLGTYSWHYNNDDGTFTGIEADSNSPSVLVENKTPLNVELGSDINLHFAKTPQKFEVNIWGDGQKIKEITVEGTSFKVKKVGRTIYEIYATWEQGTAHYAVMVNVE